MEFNGEIVEYSLKPQAASSEVADAIYNINFGDFENRLKSENNFHNDFLDIEITIQI